MTAALAALAWGLHVWLPPAPRWRVEGEYILAEFLPDGGRVLTRTWDAANTAARGPVQVWDLATGREVSRFLPDATNIRAGKLGPGGRTYVCLAEAEGQRPRLVVVDLETGAQRAAVIEVGEKEVALGVDLSPDGAVAAVHVVPAFPEGNGFYAARALMVDTATARPLAALACPTHHGFTAAGGYFLHGHYVDGEHRLGRWHVPTRQPAPALRPFPKFIQASPDGRALCTLEELPEKVAQFALWDVASGRRTPLTAEEDVSSPHFSADGRLFILGRLSGSRLICELWDARTGEKRGPLPMDWRDHDFFSPDGERVVASRAEAGANRVTVLDTATLARRWDRAWPEGYLPIGFAPDGRTLVVADRSHGFFDLVDAETGQPRRALRPLPPAPAGYEYGCTLEMQGTRLHVEVERAQAELLPPQAAVSVWEKWFGWMHPRAPVKHGPAAQLVIDLDAGREVFHLADPTVRHATLSPDGRALLTLHRNDGEPSWMQCWDVPARKPLAWVLGPPLALGAALVGVRMWWRRRRARKSAIATG